MRTSLSKSSLNKYRVFVIPSAFTSLLRENLRNNQKEKKRQRSPAVSVVLFPSERRNVGVKIMTQLEVNPLCAP